MLGITIAFQMPLVLLLLGWMGLVEVSWLVERRRWAVMVLAVVSAAITPADALSMLLMWVPLYGLYELGILLLRLIPASRVADGTVFRFSWKREKPATKKTSQPVEPAQPDSTVARDEGPSQSSSSSADEESDR